MLQGADCSAGAVLVVDDEQAILEVLSQFLESRGYKVASARSALEAEKLAQKERFDVALLDLKLPDGVGTDLLLALSEAQPGIACIIMTAFASVESTIEALRLDAFDYILKPFDLLRVGEAVDAATNYARLRREKESTIERLEKRNRELEERKEALARELARISEEWNRTNDSLKQHVTRLRVLYQMGRDISSNENWSDALDRFLMALCKYLDSEGAALLLFSDSGRSLKVRTTYQLEPNILESFIESLSQAHASDKLSTEVFCLDGLASGELISCLAVNGAWVHTAIPLLYRNRWLGFLVVRKEYRSRKDYASDYHFISTIQTILSEEVANATAISRLRNLKDFNETVLENMNGGVLTTDNSGKITFMNERARILAGSSSRELFFDDLFENPFGSGGLFEHVMSNPEDSMSFECMMSVDASRSLPVRLRTRRINRNGHHGNSIIAIFEDLRAEKSMQEELRRADRLRSLGELSAGIAHEIRNPLTGIATAAQVLREKEAGNLQAVRIIDVILGEISRLDGIISNLLSFARPAAPRISEVDLEALVEEAIELVSDRARESGVKIHFATSVADGRCSVDRDQIKQVFLNVAINAIQACEHGGKVEIGLKETNDPAFVEIEISDTGRGIPEEIADRLYDPFFTTRPEGTGMGLSISRKIIESHGGRIYHRSRVGEGTSFYLILPRRALVSARGEEVSAGGGRRRENA